MPVHTYMMDSLPPDICLFAASDKNNVERKYGRKKVKVLADTACPISVAGRAWMKNVLDHYPPHLKSLVKLEPSNINYQFGGGEQRSSLGVVTFPVLLEGV